MNVCILYNWQEAVLNGPLFVGTPIMFLMAISYSLYLVGPSALRRTLSLIVCTFYVKIIPVIISLTMCLLYVHYNVL